MRTFHMKTIFVSLVFFGLVFTQPSFGSQFFEDDFESGNLSRTRNGFIWAIPNNTAVTTERAHGGTHSLKFHFGANATGGAQQNFDLGATKTELYIRYYIYFPLNYSYRTNSNNKLIRVWGDTGDDYNSNVKLGASTWMGTPAGTARIDPDAAFRFYPSWPTQQLGCDTSLFHQGTVSSLTNGGYQIASTDLGSWKRWDWHFKPDSGAGDGAIEFWVDGAKKFGATQLRFEGAPCGTGRFKLGYLMGWANANFLVDTDIYIDDIVFSDTPIGSPDATASPKPAAPKNARAN